MRAFQRWIANHPRLCKFIMAFVVTLLCYILLDPNTFSFSTRFLITFSLLFSGFLTINTMPDKLLREPLETLEQQCDPYPFLEEMERQMSLVQENFQGQLTSINYAMALVQTGQNEKALETLESINIDRFPTASPFAKFVYYNNLCDVMMRMERFAEADIWYRKAQSIFQDLPNNKLKQRMDRTAQMNEIEALYRDQAYTTALRKLSRIPCNTQRSLMEAALLAARCNMGLEEYDKAREKLQYVIDHGNRLACVDEAKRLLEKLP